MDLDRSGGTYDLRWALLEFARLADGTPRAERHDQAEALLAYLRDADRHATVVVRTTLAGVQLDPSLAPVELPFGRLRTADARDFQTDALDAERLPPPQSSSTRSSPPHASA